eukprot:c8507_g1_i1.p1 GENE.c8507_g1_i1~~c8507_g1_i1.p1  ORF type:complete len:486 (+),score=121.88 c8507_g1_i1:647-2104(+)
MQALLEAQLLKFESQQSDLLLKDRSKTEEVLEDITIPQTNQTITVDEISVHENENEENVPQNTSQNDESRDTATQSRKNGDRPSTSENNREDSKFDDDDDGIVPFRVAHSSQVLSIRDSNVLMYTSSIGIRQFNFPWVFDGKCDQKKVYVKCGRPSVISVLHGMNACVLCYGQTGSGKTHTLFGPPETLSSSKADSETHEHSGIAFRIFEDLFIGLKKAPFGGTVAAQYVQIYGDQVTCLLSGNSVVVGSNGQVWGAQFVAIQNVQDALSLLIKGEAKKRYAQTRMNIRSSRAHTALIVTVTQHNTEKDRVSRSSLYLVDLAGSERIHKSGAQGEQQEEAIQINTSLMVLAKVITALMERRSHVPYFESKLTLLLRGALGGNCRTTTIINCREDDVHADETWQSLRFGESCAAITNQLRLAASSMSAAIRTIQESLDHCQQHLTLLEARGLAQSQSYLSLRHRHYQLTQHLALLTSPTAADGGQV